MLVPVLVVSAGHSGWNRKRCPIRIAAAVDRIRSGGTVSAVVVTMSSSGYGISRGAPPVAAIIEEASTAAAAAAAAAVVVYSAVDGRNPSTP